MVAHLAHNQETWFESNDCTQFAPLAQLVEQLTYLFSIMDYAYIRDESSSLSRDSSNQQVMCSSHIRSSIENIEV